MEKLELNTGLVNHIFSGTYGTIWDREANGEWYEYFKMENILQGYIDSDYEVLNILQDIFGDTNILQIDFTGEDSPREYNFKNDVLDFNLHVKDGFILELFNKLKNKEDFKEYLHNNYTSRDGFMSFTPNNIAELGDQLKGKGDRYEQSISAMLNYKLDQENQEWDIEMTMYEELSGNEYYTTACSECDSTNLQWKDGKDFTGYICKDCKAELKSY